MSRKKKVKTYTCYKQFVFDFFKGKKPFEKRSARDIPKQELYNIIKKYFKDQAMTSAILKVMIQIGN